MVLLREVAVDFSGSVSGTSIWHFIQSVGSLTDARAALGGFYSAAFNHCSDQVTYTVRNTGRVLESGDGQVTGIWNEPTVHTGAGGVTAEPVADATQVLFRLRTSVVRGRRLLQGRSFMPGLSTGALEAGEIGATQLGSLNSALGNFIDNAGGALAIWGRPRTGVGTDGVFGAVGSGSVWSELATQRRRRD